MLELLDRIKKDGWFYCSVKDIMRKTCRELMCTSYEAQEECEMMRI